MLMYKDLYISISLNSICLTTPMNIQKIKRLINFNYIDLKPGCI